MALGLAFRASGVGTLEYPRGGERDTDSDRVADV
jgi:hypothetical protein